MRKKKEIPSGPSKAYLVSFGDTMTALLAFFIVINAFAKEQTGANMHKGTGSFVSAVKSIGISGLHGQNRSDSVVTQDYQSPLYALAENLHRNQDGSVGPGEEDHKDRVIDFEKEEFQKFLNKLDQKFGLKSSGSSSDPLVIDSFESFVKNTDSSHSLSKHAIQLAAETIPKLRDPSAKLEIIIWPSMPGGTVLENKLKLSREIADQLNEMFWLTPAQKQRLRITVKPWLFSDAKRPVISFSLSHRL